jgi:hypothetical protein
MTTIGNESRPAYVYDAETDTWVPIGVGPHTHDEYIDKTIINAKGDIIVGTATDAVERLGTGTTGQVLVVNPSTATGLEWSNTIPQPITANSFSPTSSTIPTNGMYLGATNQVNISTNSASRVTVTDGGTTINNGFLTASRFIPSGTTLPSNGMYLVSSNNIGFATNSVNRLTIDSSGNSIFTGTVTAPVIRLTTTSDVTPTSTDHAFQIGPSTGDNLVIDDNEIMARANGVVSDLNLNFNGGDVVIGNATSNTILSGRMNATHYPWAVSANLVTVPGPSPSGPSSSVAVTFPSGRFSVTPITTATNRSTINVMASTTSVSSSGFTMNVRHVDNTNFSLGQNCGWIAIQMNSNEAGG